MPDIQFSILPLLLLLPLSLLPLFKRSGDSLVYSYTSWLPEDSIGKFMDRLSRALAMLAIASLVLGLAGPQQSETQVERIGRGAEISIIMDRSSSMDAYIHRNGVTKNDRGKKQAFIEKQENKSKNDVVREALGWLLAQRPDNRYALTLFNAAPIRVASFTDDVAIVQAGLDASDIGRGTSKTKMGLGLLAAIEGFEGRAYTGSRAIMLVSDGGAKLDEEMRKEISEGLIRNKISLYFIYIESSLNSPNLELVGTDVDSTLDEVALHVFFQELDSEYQVFQASDSDSLSKAIKRIDEQQNLPLTYFERVPRTDYSGPLYTVAFISGFCLLILMLLRRMQLG